MHQTELISKQNNICLKFYGSCPWILKEASYKMTIPLPLLIFSQFYVVVFLLTENRSTRTIYNLFNLTYRKRVFCFTML